MKKLIFIIIVILSIFIIYIVNKDRKIQYLVLGNRIDINNEIISILKENNKYERSILEFQKENYHTTDLLNDIQNNIEILKDKKYITINNALVKSELIVLNIGYYDYKDYIDNNNFKTIVNDMENLIKRIRKITKEKVILIVPKESDNTILNNIRKSYIDICNSNKVIYIDNNIKLIQYIKSDIIK